MSVHLFRTKFSCSCFQDLPHNNLLNQHKNVMTAVSGAFKVKAVRARDRCCSNNTHKEPGMLMGISECDNYMMYLGEHKLTVANALFKVIFYKPQHKHNKTLMVQQQNLPLNVTIINFRDIWSVKIFLPNGWTGCHMATTKRTI